MTNDVTQLAVIGGDGIGPEVTEQALHVLEQTVGSDAFATHEYHLGAAHWKATGEVLDDSTLAEIAQEDAIVLGAVGATPDSTEVPSGLLERGLLLKLRFALDQGVNLRPSTWHPGTSTPLSSDITDAGPIDFVVCREGTEGLYCGNGGSVRTGTPHEIATEVSVNTAFGVERVVRDAFARAALDAAISPWSTSTTCSSMPEPCGVGSSTKLLKSSRVSPLTTCTSTLSRSLWYETPSDSTSSSPTTSLVISPPILPQR